MPTDDDNGWASIRDPESISRRLETHRKLQRVILTGATVVGSLVCLFGFTLAAWALLAAGMSHSWHFLARGVTLAIVALLAGVATFPLATSDRLKAQSLREMLRGLTTHTANVIRATDLGCYSMVIVAIGATIERALRIRSGRPGAMPMSEVLLPLAVVALALLCFRISEARVLRKYRHLDHVFGSGEELQ